MPVAAGPAASVITISSFNRKVRRLRRKTVWQKAKTIEKYLGKDFAVLASYGHVRDLVPKEGAVDPEHDYAMKYRVIERNEKHVNAIIRALKKADALYLATDPDREGEAISWHLYEILREKNALDGKPLLRGALARSLRNAPPDAALRRRAPARTVG